MWHRKLSLTICTACGRKGATLRSTETLEVFRGGSSPRS
jgi:hypothetical protein